MQFNHLKVVFERPKTRLKWLFPKNITIDSIMSNTGTTYLLGVFHLKIIVFYVNVVAG